MFNATSATFQELKAYAADNNIQIDGDRRKKQSYIESIKDYETDCGTYEVDDADISLDEPESEELSWEISFQQAEAATCVLGRINAVGTPRQQPLRFAPILLLICQLVLVLLALPVVLAGGILRATAFGIDKLADWLACPKPGNWGSIQSLVLAISS